MSNRLLAFPFRVAGNGGALTVEAETEAAYRQELGLLLGTRLGERPLVPEWGVDDAAFAELDEAQIVAAVDLFGIPVAIDGVEVEYDTDTTADVLITFH